MMCECVNIKAGSYGNQVTVKAPAWSSKTHLCLDRCISDEVQSLWKVGIVTNGCCCGHNYLPAYIGVDAWSVGDILAMGYQNIAEEDCRPGGQPREQLFKPKQGGGA